MGGLFFLKPLAPQIHHFFLGLVMTSAPAPWPRTPGTSDLGSPGGDTKAQGDIDVGRQPNPLPSPTGPTLTGHCQPEALHSQKPLWNGEEAERSLRKRQKCPPSVTRVSPSLPRQGLQGFLLPAAGSHPHHPLPLPSGPCPHLGLPSTVFHFSSLPLSASR